MPKFNYIYGPVHSWRLGSSLGVDLLSGKDKICTFDCTYCQLGKTLFYTTERKIFVPTEKVIIEIKTLPDVHIDYITFSGRGEPTLAKNLGDAIRQIKGIRKEKIAVLTNASLMHLEEVRKDLAAADEVSCKLDACSSRKFNIISKPAAIIKFENILEGIRKFRKIFKGKLALQLMFLKENLRDAPNMAKIVAGLKADEIQINTPTRVNAKAGLSKPEIKKISKYFSGPNIISVYGNRPHKEDIKSISNRDTLRRRGKIK